MQTSPHLSTSFSYVNGIMLCFNGSLSVLCHLRYMSLVIYIINNLVMRVGLFKGALSSFFKLKKHHYNVVSI